MKLRNKKTGEIGNLKPYGGDEKIWVWIDNKSKPEYRYNSLAELNEEWCDYEEPKEYWFIDEFGLVQKETEYYYEENKEAVHDKRIAVGNYFETKEEAEKAAEKLKAWKRLNDKGFDFVGCFKDNTINYEFVERPLDYDEAEEAEQDLAFLFGGEE